MTPKPFDAEKFASPKPPLKPWASAKLVPKPWLVSKLPLPPPLLKPPLKTGALLSIKLELPAVGVAPKSLPPKLVPKPLLSKLDVNAMLVPKPLPSKLGVNELPPLAPNPEDVMPIAGDPKPETSMPIKSPIRSGGGGGGGGGVASIPGAVPGAAGAKSKSRPPNGSASAASKAGSWTPSASSSSTPSRGVGELPYSLSGVGGGSQLCCMPAPAGDPGAAWCNSSAQLGHFITYGTPSIGRGWRMRGYSRRRARPTATAC